MQSIHLHFRPRAIQQHFSNCLKYYLYFILETIFKPDSRVWSSIRIVRSGIVGVDGLFRKFENFLLK